jgi:hypothetical protein
MVIFRMWYINIFPVFSLDIMPREYFRDCQVETFIKTSGESVLCTNYCRLVITTLKTKLQTYSDSLTVTEHPTAANAFNRFLII